MTQAQPIIVTGTVSTDEQPAWGPSSISKRIFASLPQADLAVEQILHFSRSVPVDLFQQALDENRTLRGKVETLEGQMASLLSALGLDQPDPRDLPRTQATREIQAYFRLHDGEEIYPDDIAGALNLDLMLVIGICEELENAGKIATKT